MTGRILIVDPVVTTRITLKVKLASAHYDVDQAGSMGEALRLLGRRMPDLILCDPALPDGDLGRLKAALARVAGASYVPIVALLAADDRDGRLAALLDGAEDVITRPYSEASILARVRAQLRAQVMAQDLRTRTETTRAFGFAEAQAGFTKPSRVALVGASRGDAMRWREALGHHMDCSLTIVPMGKVMAEAGDGPGYDGYIIAAPAAESGLCLRLLSELRARLETRRAAVLVVITGEDKDNETGVTALDIGAEGVLATGFDAEEAALRMTRLLKRKSEHDALHRALDEGLRAAVTDPLTGLFNRRYALPHLSKLAHSAQASGHTFAVMLLDIDHFKQINDRYGHAVGDAVLAEFADRLRNRMRAADLFARIGGEEFLIALPGTHISKAKHAAERLCQLVTSRPFATDHVPGGIAVSMSVGLVVGGPQMPHRTDNGEPDVEALIRRADEALYRAKNAGRNMVQVSGSAAA